MGPLFVPGLSPLPRGTPDDPRCYEQTQRFIPAGAGNSGDPAIHDKILAVYPRWRGELGGRRVHICLISRFIPAGAGNSIALLQRHSLPPRFIPAGAGNSNPISVGAALLTVYPRWRGELTPQGLTRNRQGRFIPAGAGELSKHNLLLINDFLSQSQSTNFTVSHKQHIHYVKEHLTN